MNKERIISLLSENKETIRSFGVLGIGLFGSYSRDEQTEESDIDLIVDFIQDQKTYRNFIQLAYYLEGILGKKTEVLTRNSLNARMKKQIEAKEFPYIAI